MSISLENWIRNKLQENEEMHDYAVATDSVRAWIDEWKEVEASSNVNWMQNTLNKINQNDNPILVIGSGSIVGLEVLKLLRGKELSFGLDIGMGDDVGVESRKRVTKQDILEALQYMERNDKTLPMEVEMQIKNYNYDLEALPEAKQKPIFNDRDSKPHPTNWRQSNRHYKRRK